jgi:hypothetical protein
MLIWREAGQYDFRTELRTRSSYAALLDTYLKERNTVLTEFSGFPAYIPSTSVKNGIVNSKVIFEEADRVSILLSGATCKTQGFKLLGRPIRPVGTIFQFS